ncbi:MAG: hypothetical protein EOM69_02900 [Clostridia bacterium]|nr:hypothetical protein [Clostridia bacterium]
MNNDTLIPPTSGTFIVQVLYRRNGTWQGVLKWTDGRREQQFRSAFEMLKLMDEALANVIPETED